MKTRFSLVTVVTLLWLLLNIASPASAQTLYENGPINGEMLGWTINLGFFVADSFTIANSNSTIEAAFLSERGCSQGDVLESAEVSITQYPLSGEHLFRRHCQFHSWQLLLEWQLQRLCRRPVCSMVLR